MPLFLNYQIFDIEWSPEPIAEANLVSIVGKTLKGSLTAVLHESVKEHGGNKEGAAKELDISLEMLEMWLAYRTEVNGNNANNSLQTAIMPSRQFERFSYEETRRLLIEPILVFYFGEFCPFSMAGQGPEWSDADCSSRFESAI